MYFLYSSLLVYIQYLPTCFSVFTYLYLQISSFFYQSIYMLYVLASSWLYSESSYLFGCLTLILINRLTHLFLLVHVCVLSLPVLFSPQIPGYLYSFPLHTKLFMYLLSLPVLFFTQVLGCLYCFPLHTNLFTSLFFHPPVSVLFLNPPVLFTQISGYLNIHLPSTLLLITCSSHVCVFLSPRVLVSSHTCLPVHELILFLSFFVCVFGLPILLFT